VLTLDVDLMAQSVVHDYTKSSKRVYLHLFVEEMEKTTEQRVWNGLNFPAAQAATSFKLLNQFDTIDSAFRHTALSPSVAPPDNVKPKAHLRWGMMNTRNTFSDWHCDAGGSATWIQILNDGAKVWVVPSLMPDANRSVYDGKRIDLNAPEAGQAEAVYVHNRTVLQVHFFLSSSRMLTNISE